MRTICIKTKVKKEDLREIREWFQTLKRRKDETLQTLINEEVLVESAYLDLQGDDFFIIYYLKAKNIDKAYDVFNKSTHSIDVYFKSCWQKHCKGRWELEELIDLENF